MAHVMNYTNIPCLSCSNLEKDMIMIGPMVFCWGCFEKEFKAIYANCKVDSLNPIYKKWLEVYKEKSNNA